MLVEVVARPAPDGGTVGSGFLPDGVEALTLTGQDKGVEIRQPVTLRLQLHLVLVEVVARPAPDGGTVGGGFFPDGVEALALTGQDKGVDTTQAVAVMLQFGVALVEVVARPAPDGGTVGGGFFPDGVEALALTGQDKGVDTTQAVAVMLQFGVALVEVVARPAPDSRAFGSGFFPDGVEALALTR